MDFTYFLANPNKLKGGSSNIPDVSIQKQEENTSMMKATNNTNDVSGGNVSVPTQQPKDNNDSCTITKKSMMPWTDLIVNQRKKMN